MTDEQDKLGEANIQIWRDIINDAYSYHKIKPLLVEMVEANKAIIDFIQKNTSPAVVYNSADDSYRMKLQQLEIQLDRAQMMLIQEIMKGDEL